MTDFLAGQTLTDLHFPPTTDDREVGSYTITTTTFGVGTTGGVYADCGVAFTAPITGKVDLEYGGQMSNSTTNATIITPVVRLGATIGSGTTIVAATDDNNVQVTGTSSQRRGASLLLQGLTPGTVYNVRLEHRVSLASTGTLQRRYVTATPRT
jgi:hypothetical protein